MKLSHLIITITILGITFSSCDTVCTKGSGKITTETRQVGDFSQITLSGAYQVTIKQAATTSVSITGDDNLMDRIKTDVSSNKLSIETKSGICPSGETVVNIGVKDLSLIKASGAVAITSDGKITTRDMALDLAGVTKVVLTLNADNLTTTGSGMTELTLNGQATTHKLNISGAGHVNALDFVVGKYTIESSGASTCKINVLNELNVNSSGASDIEYRGNPGTINNSKSGAGSLKKIN